MDERDFPVEQLREPELGALHAAAVHTWSRTDRKQDLRIQRAASGEDRVQNPSYWKHSHTLGSCGARQYYLLAHARRAAGGQQGELHADAGLRRGEARLSELHHMRVEIQAGLRHSAANLHVLGFPDPRAALLPDAAELEQPRLHIPPLQHEVGVLNLFRHPAIITLYLLLTLV